MSKEKILRLLIDKKQPITSKMFARYLDVSSRTVINYIKEINYTQKSPVITSGQQGYSASVNEIVNVLKEMQNNNEIPQDFNERSTYIVKELLLKKMKLNIYDVTSDLFISLSTLKNDIYKTNKIYKKHNCTIKYDNDKIYMSGKEEDKRSLLSVIIRRETVGSLMDLNILKDLFNDCCVTEIKNSLDATLKNNQLYINDYAYMNFLLHLSIIIDNASVSEFENNKLDFSSINDLTKELYDSIYKSLEIPISQDQLDQINNLLQIQFTDHKSKTKEETMEIVASQTLINSKVICKQVEKLFLIDISQEKFLMFFSHHLENLLKRLESDHHEVNPITQIIKRDNPMIYEIAVFIMLVIIDIYDLNDNNVTEDEISFIALHVGSAISKNNQDRDKLKTVIVCPKYRDTRENLVNNITEHFNNALVIEKVISYPHELKDTDYDILIKTVPDDIFMTKNSILVSILDYEKNKVLIQEKITNIHNKNNTDLLIEKFDEIFNPNIFFNIDGMFKDKNQVINFLGQNMIDLKLIDEKHLDNIIKRENISSTAFGNITIPHALDMSAHKTSISVLVSSDGIQWDNSIVNIVILIAICNTDIKLFRPIYQGIFSIFEDENIPLISKQLNDYNDLKDFFIKSNRFVT